jgi:tetratricopeptide (TPR) repeat protein
MRSRRFDKQWRPALIDLANVRYSRALVCQLLTKYDESLKELRQSRNLGRTSGDAGAVIRSWAREIHIRYLQGELEKGIALARNVLAHPAIESHLSDKAQAYNSLGNIHLRHHDVDRAAESFGTAQAIYRQLSDELAQARVECNLANIHNLRGDNANALRLYRHAEEVFTRHGDIYTMAHVSKAIGQVLLDMGDQAGARDSLNRTLQLSTKTQDYRRQASALLDIANLDNTYGRPEDALCDIERSREISEAHGITDPNHLACFNGTLAEIYYSLGRWDEAGQAVRTMLAISETNGFIIFQAEGYNLLGLVTLKKTKGAAGMELIERGSALADEHRLDYQIYSGRTKMAEAYAWLGHREKAIALYREAIALAAKVGSDVAPIMREIAKLEGPA